MQAISYDGVIPTELGNWQMLRGFHWHREAVTLLLS